LQNFVKKNRTRIVKVTFIRGANQKINSSELEKISLFESIAKETEIKAAEHPIYCIEYLNQPFYGNLKDMVKIQIGSCERLFINTKNIDERNVIQRETLMLKLVLELLEY
jgi:hypothetical protein